VLAQNLSRHVVSATGQKSNNNNSNKNSAVAVNDQLASIKRSATKLCFHTFGSSRSRTCVS